MTRHTHYDPADEDVSVREVVTRDDGFFAVSLPISSDSTARDGDAFDTERLRGFAEQINGDRTIPVFLSHGEGPLSDQRYGAVGKIGRVRGADLETRDGTTLLTANLEIASPDTLAKQGDTGDVESTLRWVRQQFELGLGSVSVGWNEDTGGRDVPGDAELLEVSVVGIESDTQAQQASAEATEAVTRGVEALPDREETSRHGRREVGPRGFDFGTDELTDVERAEEALDRLQHVREHHSQDDDVPHYRRRDETPPTLATIDEVRRLTAHSVTTTDLEERLGELIADGHRAEREREDILGRLDTIEEHASKLAQPQISNSVRGARTVVYPFGQSQSNSREQILDAVGTLRDVLGESPDTDSFWGEA